MAKPYDIRAVRSPVENPGRTVSDLHGTHPAAPRTLPENHPIVVPLRVALIVDVHARCHDGVVTGRDDLDADDLSGRCRRQFLTDLWGFVIDEDEWVESWLPGTPPGPVPDDPVAAALHRILECGVDLDDLADVVRTAQHEVIYNVCQLLDDPALLGIRRGTHPDQIEAGWELTAVRTAPPASRRPIGELHVELDEHDPSGRGGEPRGRPVPARLPGQPLYARIAVAQARAGDRLAAIKTWRAATGATSADAKAALDALLEGARN